MSRFVRPLVWRVTSICCLLSLPSVGRAAVESAAEPRVPAEVRELLADRDYAAAVEAIGKFAGDEAFDQDYLAYLKGRALYLDGKYDDAAAALAVLEKKYPQSAWLRRARFALGLALARKGDFRAAELIYQREAKSLLAPERKQELADIFLEFAGKYFEPTKSDQKPDYQKALEFYQKALEIGPQSERREEIELLVAECYQHLGQLDEAGTRYARFSKEHPGSRFDIEARYRLGEVQLAQGQPGPARRTWQDLLADYPDSRSERLPEARFNLAQTFQIPQPATDEDLTLGVTALEAFIERHPEHELASQAYLRIAQAYIHRGRYESAGTSLKRFLNDPRYVQRPEIAAARNLLGKSYQLQKKYAEALAIWREFLAEHPTNEAWSTVQRAILDTEYLMAQDARQAKRYDAARKLWSEFLSRYPLDPRAPEILYQLGEMHYEEQQYDDALADWRRLVSKYPNTEEASHGQYMIALTLEEHLDKLKQALKEYRKVTYGSHAAAAQMRAQALVAESLTLVTPRVFRSNEAPTLKLTTRNIESLTVRVYSVDLETYFRKMHLGSGIESLDIALIDPDKSFEFKVPDYARYRRLESDLELPLPAENESGVVAVTVSGKNLEATTLAIRSDLDVVIKSSRDEVFVFAENLRTQKPWANVRLLVSNGKRIFAEGTTGDDGVFQKTFKELKNSGDVRVFAVADDNVASNLVDLQGLGVAKGIADKGYLYTDRAAYRPGQLVHVRGLIRRVSGDAYTVEVGKKFTVNVLDSRQRMVREEKVELSEFGSFHLNFLLPPTSALGEYRIQVQNDEGQNYAGSFLVHEYQLEPVRLEVDTPRKVYYRGEEIVGKIEARFYYGAPLAGREISYRLGGERIYTAKTDARGEIDIKLPTREFRETQVLPLVVTLGERDLQSTTNFFLVTQGFAVEVATVRPVYLAGESFEATLSVRDAEGKPLAQKIELEVLEQTLVEGRVGERLIERHELVTDAKQGQARQTLTLKDGGNYILRAGGIDRFQNRVTGDRKLQISDEHDRVRLRILADKHTYKVGEQAQVVVHWRQQPALALVTYQGARVLDYRVIELKTGANRLAIPMSARLAPNFDLSIAVMTDELPVKAGDEKNRQPVPGAVQEPATEAPRRFHVADSPFTVERDLHLELQIAGKGKQEPVRPGDAVEVRLKTTDPQGKPVAAEVSLAMIEQALVERFGTRVPAIHDFFRGAQRQAAVRTTSSAAFHYCPETRSINARLLADQERREIAGEEAESLREALPAATTLVLDEAQRAPEEELTRSAVLPSPFYQTDDVDYSPADAENRMLDQGAGMGDADDSERAFGFSLLGAQSIQTFERHGGKPQQLAKQVPLFSQLAQAQTFDITGRPGLPHFTGDLDIKWQDGSAPIVYPNAQIWSELQDRRQRAVVVLHKSGEQSSLNLEDAGGAQGERLATALARAGAVLLPQILEQQTGYWNPAIVTDARGEATVSFDLPEQSTAWKFLAKGITAATLAGEAEADLTVKKPLFGELKLPLAFTAGDEARITASIHNELLDKGELEVVLKTTIGSKSVEQKQILKVKAKGIEELSFKTTFNKPEKAEDDPAAGDTETVNFELAVRGPKQSHVVRRTLPLLPYGMPVYALASGSASSDTTAWVESPPGMPLVAPQLQILIGPTVQRSLLDVVLAPPPACQLEASRLASGLDVTVGDLMASLALEKLVGDSRDAGAPPAQALDARVRSALSLLVSAQNDDGGWCWTAKGTASNRYTTARVVWALSLARASGYTTAKDSFDKAVVYLQSQVAATAESDLESKAILLQALAAAGHGDFALANRLFRDRPALSNSGLAYLALAFAEMNRKVVAGELLELLAKRDFEAAATRRRDANGALPWSQAPAELHALYALALQKVNPQDALAKKQVDWLLSHRVGHRWSPEKATGPAMLALNEWFGKNRFQGEHYQLSIFVNDSLVKKLDVQDDRTTFAVDVPSRLLKEGKQRINFQIAGRGQFTYECMLAGFVAAEKLRHTTDDWAIERHYEPAPLELDGREISRGFGVLQGSYTEFRNPLGQLPLGKRGQVELKIWRSNLPANTPDEQLEYLVVTEPLPAGATPLERSIRGGFERYELAPGAITFYIGSRRHVEPIRYDLNGYLPGKYRAAPSLLRDAYRPDRIAVAEAKSLVVLPAGEPSTDPYRLTPQELYELGKRRFEQGEFAEAARHLAELLGKWNVGPEYYKESARMLLDVHLETGPPAQIVHYFEIVKEKWPDLEVSFAKILKVGAAYHELGEYERSYLIFRATVESSFSTESVVAGFLQAQGEFVRSVEVMQRLLAEHPPEPYIAAATYALAQRVYAKAGEAAVDPRLRERRINRVVLVKQALGMLESFLTAYPEDPAADQAAFSVAGALLELKAYPVAIRACNRFAARYPQSEYLDSYWYVIGFCHFALGEHEAALEMCRQVAEAKQLDKATGHERPSRNKWRAIYILGQVYHSLGDAAAAIREYSRVKGRFPDARQAIDYFTHKRISLPEVTTVEPGKPAELELAFRNVAECDVKVYRIDLMKFSLLQRNLGGITKINLAGIRPQHETTLELGDGRDYRDRTRTVDLPLKDEGAYLVVCRGDNLHASGLVLVTPLAIEVQEQPSSGTVRTTIKNKIDERYQPAVEVKVIGARNADFTSGQTDLRGVFSTDGIQGASTVIAQAEGGRYAFFRGTLDLGPPPPPANEPAAAATEGGKPLGGKAGKDALLDDLNKANYDIQQKQQQQLQQLYDNNEKGVKVQKAF